MRESVWLRKRAERQRSRAGRNVAGCRGELAVCRALSSLAQQGHFHLDDLRWRADPRQRANIDHLVIGPAGVFVVDAKLWAGRVEVRGQSLAQDGVPCDDRLVALTYLRARVEEVMAATSAAKARPHAVVCFARPRGGLPAALGGTLLTDVGAIGALLASRPTVLTAAQVAELVDVLGYAFPAYETDQQAAAEAEGLLFPELVTRHAGLTEALARPVEDWMVWLHPEQAGTVRRVFAGPARIRGAAGTGKTAVALHRVAWLASTRPGRFLVTSYVRTLPEILATSYARLSPATTDRVDFRSLHAVALGLLRERGITVHLDSRHTAFNAAWSRCENDLTGTGLTKSYFEEEVDSVIKGRQLLSLDDYLALDRVGRRTPLRAEQRRAVWRLKEEYDAELASRRLCDFTDVLSLALEEVRREPCTTWQAVVVDEVQDIPLVGLRLLHELAGRDRTDGLLLIGDGQQAIYPGGFRLSEAGISVAGRASVLRTNHRNTVEIVATAQAVVADDSYDDVDVVGQAGDREVEVVRHGAVPSNTSYLSRDEHDVALMWDLQQVLSRGERPGSIALLCPTNVRARHYAALLYAHGVPNVLLKTASPEDVDAVRVGTWHRAKGLEFPHVFLPDVGVRTMLTTGAGAQARAEKEELLRRALFVAMTRARDTLWVGRVDPASGR